MFLYAIRLKIAHDDMLSWHDAARFCKSIYHASKASQTFIDTFAVPNIPSPSPVPIAQDGGFHPPDPQSVSAL